ncbi:MAG: repeat containing protein [Cyanobacteria bacterium RYN_339]|nr:repeat containing protein [Cyanobacteria bacterium RYN_339]
MVAVAGCSLKAPAGTRGGVVRGEPILAAGAPVGGPSSSSTSVLGSAQSGGIIANNAGGLIGNNAGGLIANNAGSLTGTLRGPAAGLIANNAAGLLSNNAAGLISNNAGGLISNNSGGLISNNAGGLRLLSIDELSEPVGGVEVEIYDAAGNVVSLAPVKTDASGSYTFDKLKPSGPVLFVRAVYDREGQKVTLEATTAAPRAPGSVIAAIDPATSLVAKKIQELVRKELVKVASLQPEALQKIAKAVSAAMNSKAVVAAAILPNDKAAAAYDTMLSESAPLASSVDAVAKASDSPGLSAAAPATPRAPHVESLVGGAMGDVDGNRDTVRLSSPSDLVVDAAGNVYVVEAGSNKVRKITPAGVATTFASGFNAPGGIALAHDGLFVADTNNHLIRKVGLDGKPTTLAGSAAGFADGVGPAARFDTPYGLAVDAAGILYVADTHNHRIRQVTPDGTVTTLAGGDAGLADGPGAEARFRQPWGLALDGKGALYVADAGNHRVCKLDLNNAAHAVTTVAGGAAGFADGVGANARFTAPEDVGVAPNGALYVADTGNHRIRKIAPDGTVTTVAGGSAGYVDGSADQARFNFPQGLAVDGDGDLIVADTLDHAIRLVFP